MPCVVYDRGMVGRAEGLLARVWRCASAQAVQSEAALEAALAAALEHPGVWPQLRARLDLEAYPIEPPRVITQERVDTGRTDITLGWVTKRLVLELKQGMPPSEAQLRAYLETGADVLAIAKYPGWIDVVVQAGGVFRGFVTWAEIRGIDWAEAPLVWRQLCSLIDVLEVAVQRVTLTGLQGIVDGWDARATIEAITYPAIERLSDQLTRAGLPSVLKDTPREQVKLQNDHGRMVWWTWPSPWDSDELGIYAGMLITNPHMPPLVSGAPDLILGLHLKPDSSFGAAVREDESLRLATDRWCARGAPDDVRRERAAHAHEWTLLRARASALVVLQAPDQAARITEWMTARAGEWIADGVIECLAALNERRLVRSGGG